MSAYYWGCDVWFDEDGCLDEVRIDSIEEYAANGFADVVAEARAAGVSDEELGQVIEERVAAAIRSDDALARKLYQDQYEPDPDRHRL